MKKFVSIVFAVIFCFSAFASVTAAAMAASTQKNINIDEIVSVVQKEATDNVDKEEVSRIKVETTTNDNTEEQTDEETSVSGEETTIETTTQETEEVPKTKPFTFDVDPAIYEDWTDDYVPQTGFLISLTGISSAPSVEITIQDKNGKETVLKFEKKGNYSLCTEVPDGEYKITKIKSGTRFSKISCKETAITIKSGMNTVLTCEEKVDSRIVRHLKENWPLIIAIVVLGVIYLKIQRNKTNLDREKDKKEKIVNGH